MRLLRYIMLLLLLLPCSGAFAAGASHDGGEAKVVDVKKIIFDHVKDSYEWHITTVGDKHITLPLPIIIYSSRTGWEVFSSSVFHYADEHNGFRISRSGNYEGKIVELDAEGKERRPLLDLSLTKTVVSVFIISFLLILIVVGTARWYTNRKPSDEAPRGFVGVMEMVIIMVVEDVIRPNVGSAYKKYVPFILTVFFMIFLTNLMGLLPIFPGGANVTGNISVALALALCTFVAVNFFGNK